MEVREAGKAGARRLLPRLGREPLNADLHFDLALAAASGDRHHLALAELKTADYLGLAGRPVERLAREWTALLPDPDEMGHNQHFRFTTLAAAIHELGGTAAPSVCDVGGGEGQLASFLPRSPYCLVEPKVNGISGADLPFADGAFDYVIACHVLEHIAPAGRELFLDQLLSKARRGVILLNPFVVDGTHVDERLQLFVDVTGAAWAREHLECTLPHVESLADYARERGLDLRVAPNGTLTTSMAMVFVDYFAAKAGLEDERKQVNRFFNTKFRHVLDSSGCPNAYLVHLLRRA